MAFIVTETGNRIHRSCILRETKNIVLGGKTTLLEKVTLDAKPTTDKERGGTGASITIGRYCRIGRLSKITPATREDGYVQIKIGDYVDFGDRVESRAIHIASCVRIGEGAKIGNGCVIREGVIIERDAELPDGMVVPALSRVSGIPARIVEELPECIIDVLRSRMRGWYAEQ